ncbi:hypothetical protein [Rhodococcus sp. BH5]|uniref:hypothetical protein n=1 Tax=Rhodococcus sp. BH5 TaxID=2871702 RepID=UPI0022CDB044|nr:hypothetical protein [Rhodococcus sp. BH5]MCZ9635143.1 hypothetical protein [Rhodococcus sp. BH5]
MAHEVIDKVVQCGVFVTSVPVLLLGAANNWSNLTMTLLMVPMFAILLKPDIASTIVYGIANTIGARRESPQAIGPTHQISEETK